MNAETEQNELRRIADAGFEFEVQVIRKKRLPGIQGFFKRKVTEKESLFFLLKEPTLAVFDLINMESSKMEKVVSDAEDFENYIKIYARKHSQIMAKILAIAVLGKNLFYMEGFQVKTDEKEIKRLQAMFHKFLHPSDMYNLLQVIDLTSNLGDFINSARLMTAAEKIKIKADPAEQLSQE